MEYILMPHKQAIYASYSLPIYFIANFDPKFVKSFSRHSFPLPISFFHSFTFKYLFLLLTIKFLCFLLYFQNKSEQSINREGWRMNGVTILVIQWKFSSFWTETSQSSLGDERWLTIRQYIKHFSTIYFRALWIEWLNKVNSVRFWIFNSRWGQVEFSVYVEGKMVWA